MDWILGDVVIIFSYTNKVSSSGQTMILYLCRKICLENICGGKHVPVLCFSISRGGARIPDPSDTWSVESFV